MLKGMNMLPPPDMGVTDPLLTETPQSVLATLWYFAGTPNSRRENAEAFARSAFLPQPKITDFRPGAPISLREKKLSWCSLIFTPWGLGINPILFIITMRRRLREEPQPSAQYY